MDSETIPNWFRWLFHYYEDREKLFVLMDLFNIIYPSWAKEYKMPYDYSEEELEIFINPKYDRHICNGEIFRNNIGFFWKNINCNNGDTYKILINTKSFTDYIPWQLILSNSLWATDKLFGKILNAIKKNQPYSYYYFAIQDYIKISEGQAGEMAKLLPKGQWYDVHKKFVENNKNIIKENQFLANMFKDKICDNQYSTFHYLKFPIEIQKEFVRGYKGYYSKIELIKKMDISKEDKIKFAMEFTKQEFN
jgi:hypothetical protein